MNKSIAKFQGFAKPCVLVVGGSKSYYSPFARFGPYEDNINILQGSKKDVQKKVNLVLFTGGEDVCPSLYGEKTGSRTGFNINRDRFECLVFQMAKAYELPMVGVCRGAQFLCVMDGGKLVQHVSHPNRHPVRLWDGRSVIMNSLHHQMQLPRPEAQIIGWIDEPLSEVHLDGEDEEINIDKEAEIVYYPAIKSVSCQYHPEMMSEDSDGFKIAAEIVDHFLFQKHEEKVA